MQGGAWFVKETWDAGGISVPDDAFRELGWLHTEVGRRMQTVVMDASLA